MNDKERSKIVGYAELQRMIDDDLVALGLQGNREALDTLFARHRRMVYSIAYRILRNCEEAEDAVQNCLVLAFGNLPQYNKRCGHFRSWIGRIVINEALSLLRKQKASKILSFNCLSVEEQQNCLDRCAASGPNPEQAFLTRESVHAIRKAVLLLPAHVRSAVVLRDLLGHSTQEAADALGLPPSILKTNLFRGRRKLGTLMRKRYSRSEKPVFPVSTIGRDDEVSGIPAGSRLACLEKSRAEHMEGEPHETRWMGRE